MEKRKQLPAYPQAGVASTCRSFDEYCAMFGLDPSSLEGPVLDVAGGASSFTAALRAKGISAVAADPFYGGLTEEVIDAGYREIQVSSAKIAAMKDAFDWSFYGSPERHRSIRERSMALFADDFRKSEKEEQTVYFPAALPSLPFPDDSFRLAICSHFLFLYAESFDRDFHVAAIGELLRVLRPGGELRVYPLVNLRWEPYPHLSDIVKEFEGVATHEFQPSGLPFTPTKSPLLRMVKNGVRSGVG